MESFTGGVSLRKTKQFLGWVILAVAAVYTALLVWLPQRPPLAVCGSQPYGNDGMLISICNRGWMPATLASVSTGDAPHSVQPRMLVSQQTMTPTDIQAELATAEGLRKVAGTRVRPERSGAQYTLYLQWPEGQKYETTLHYRFFGVPLRLMLPGAPL